MAKKARIDWTKDVDWNLSDRQIAAMYGYTEGYVTNKRRELFGYARITRKATLGEKVFLTEELSLAARESAHAQGLTFSEWMRRAAEMKLAAEGRANG